MSIESAEDHLRKVVENVNAVVGHIYATKVFSAEEIKSENQETALDESSIYFNPLSGNVIFGSAQDGWGFIPQIFAKMFASKLNVPYKILKEAMWGDFFFNNKQNRCETRESHSKDKPTIFVQLILRNIWSLYKNVMFGNLERVPDFCEKLKLQYRCPSSSSKASSVNRRSILKSIFMEWLPLDQIIFQRVVKHVKSPSQMFNSKLAKLMNTTDKPDIKFKDEDIVVFVAKMLPISYRELQACDKNLQNIYGECVDSDQDTICIGFARIYSGVLKKDSKVHIVKSTYDPKLKNVDELKQISVKQIYIIMGRNFDPIKEACSGNVQIFLYSYKF